MNSTFKTALKTEGFIIASLYVTPIAIAAIMYLVTAPSAAAWPTRTC